MGIGLVPTSTNTGDPGGNGPPVIPALFCKKKMVPPRISTPPESIASGLTGRLCHTSHHRGQQMAMLRMLGRSMHSNYGPTADTGGLMQQHAPTIYAYPDLAALLDGEALGGAKTELPGRAGRPVTERP